MLICGVATIIQELKAASVLKIGYYLVKCNIKKRQTTVFKIRTFWRWMSNCFSHQHDKKLNKTSYPQCFSTAKMTIRIKPSSSSSSLLQTLLFSSKITISWLHPDFKSQPPSAAASFQMRGWMSKGIKKKTPQQQKNVQESKTKSVTAAAQCECQHWRTSSTQFSPLQLLHWGPLESWHQGWMVQFHTH